MRRPLRNPALCRAAILATILLTTGRAPILAADPPTVWLTGPALEKQLDEPAGLRLQGVSLREALRDLGQERRVSLLIDRRIDPSLALDVDASGSLRSVLDRLAAERGAAVRVVQGVVYLGPANVVAALPAERQKLRMAAQALPREDRAPLLAARRWQWNDLDTPRELLEQLQRESKWKFEGLEAVPHDLWAGAELPAVPWLDRALLVLAQFDRTLELDGARRVARIVPWRAEAPPIAGGKLANAPRRKPAAKRTAKLEVREARLGDVLRSIAVQFELELQIDEGFPQEALAAPITFSAGDLELEPLLEKLLQGRARFAVAEGELRISPP